MTPWMSEAFFADVVVLVEGEADRAAVVGAALVKGEDFESMGIAVIPCGGKSNMDRPALVFKGLGIPTYLVWDADKGDTEGLRANHILQRIVGETPVDWPAGIRTTYACFESDLETTLRAEMGPAYGEEMSSVMREFGYANMKQGEKNPRVVQEALKRVGAKGGTSTTLQAIVAAIRSLHKEQARVS